MRQVIDLITLLLMLINLANLPYKNGNCCALVKKNSSKHVFSFIINQFRYARYNIFLKIIFCFVTWPNFRILKQFLN